MQECVILGSNITHPLSLMHMKRETKRLPIKHKTKGVTCHLTESTEHLRNPAIISRLEGSVNVDFIIFLIIGPKWNSINLTKPTKKLN